MKTLKLKFDFSNITEFESVMSTELKGLWDTFCVESANGFSYQDLQNWQSKFKPLGLSFNYGLDADAYDFKIKLTK